MTPHRLALAILLLVLCLPACARPAAAPKIVLEPCTLADGISARCGSLTVFEDRAARQGRTIDVQVAVIPAADPNPAPDPIFYLAGGPGGSAIAGAAYARQVLGSTARRRDLVLVDQRGTGGSNPLACPRDPAEAAWQVPLDDAMVAELRGCLDALDADPAAYTTAWAMDDLDDVRAALGYEQINLYGESYGATAAQVYLLRHESHVRTMAVEGVSLLDVPMFERMPRSSQAALDRLQARCAADPACRAAYPNLPAELAEVIARVEQQPVELSLKDPRTGRPVIFNRAGLVLGLHGLLTGTESAVLLPHLVHQMAQEDYSGVTYRAAASYTSVAPPPTWVIMNLTILCFEEWARMLPEETTRFSQGSYLGYEAVRRFTIPEEICAALPRPQPAALYGPVQPSRAPVLLITNEADPQNPPDNVAGAKEVYPNSLAVVAPGQGHGYTGIPCRAGFIAEFIERAETSGLDTGCLEKEPLPEFP